MKRVVKEPETRRLEIIAAAKKLFIENGYENTSVEAIIHEAGIAKGTFYYYFKTKKDILKALTQQLGDELYKYFTTIAEAKNLTAIQKLTLMIGGSEKKAIVESPVMEIVHHPENRELHEKLNAQAIEFVAPIITTVIKQGKDEGVFKTTVSTESIQLLMAGTQLILDSNLFHWKPKKRAAFLRAIQKMFEQALKAKSGALNFITKL